MLNYKQTTTITVRVTPTNSHTLSKHRQGKAQIKIKPTRSQEVTKRQTSLPKYSLISNSKLGCQQHSSRWEMPLFASVKIVHSTTMIKRTDKVKTMNLRRARLSYSPKVMRPNSIEISRSQGFRSSEPETTWIKLMLTSQLCPQTILYLVPTNTPLPKKTPFLIAT